MAIPWTDLIVTDDNGQCIGTLGDVVATSLDMLAGLVISDGRIAEWQQVFIAAPDEDPDWDTPRVDVEWSGFVDAVRDAARRARAVVYVRDARCPRCGHREPMLVQSTETDEHGVVWFLDGDMCRTCQDEADLAWSE